MLVKKAVNILFIIMTSVSMPSAKYGNRYLWDEWMKELTRIN